MPEREVTGLFQNIVVTLGWLNHRLNTDSFLLGHSRQHVRILLQLYMGGKSLLKNLAVQTDVSSPNLCAILKTLEHDGFVLRQSDDADRRNTWYSLTPAGEKVAEKGLLEMRRRIAKLFAGLNQKDEARLASALRVLDEILCNIKSNYKE